MGWLFGFIIDTLAALFGEAVVNRMSPRGCFLVLAGIAALVLLAIWLAS